MDDIGNSIAGLLITLVILFVIFLVMRELMCWYWKINEAISILKSIDNKLSNDHNSSRNINEAKAPDSISVLPTNKEIVKIGPHDFVSLKGELGEAFCAKCRTIGSKTNMLYCKEIDTFYHVSCAEK